MAKIRNEEKEIKKEKKEIKILEILDTQLREREKEKWIHQQEEIQEKVGKLK